MFAPPVPAQPVAETPVAERNVVAFVTGHGELAPSSGLSIVAESLLPEYDVREVDLSVDPNALDDVRVLVMAGDPDVPDAELYQIDQFLMRGGRALFLLDAARLPSEGVQSRLSPANVFGYLDAYGVVINPDLVLDRTCAPGAVWTAISTDDPYPLWPLVTEENMADDGPLSNLESLQLGFTSSITTMREMPGNTRCEVLARSSTDSWTISAHTSLDPSTIPPSGVRSSEALRVAHESGFPLAVLVLGEFESAFLGKKLIVERGRSVEVVEPVDMIERGVPSAMMVLGGSAAFRDAFVARHPENASIAKSVIDWLAGEGVRAIVYSGRDAEAGADARGGSVSLRASAWVLLVSALAAAAVLVLLAIRRMRRRGR
jgi:hypothetical protein